MTIGQLVFTHEDRLRKVIDIMSRRYIGKLIYINCENNIEVRCTPNHLIRVYDEIKQIEYWKAAIELLLTDKLVHPIYPSRYRRIRALNKERYVGLVYNLSVEEDKSYQIKGGLAVHNCDFSMGVEGSYYSKYLDRLRVQGRIGDVPWESAFKVFTAWDLGVRDSTCIIFFQVIGQTIKLIDCYENSKQGLEHYVKVLESKPYSYGKHIAPHDIKVQEFGSGITRIEKAKQLGIKFTVADDISIPDGIEAVRSAYSKIWIDEKNCALLIKALENYRQEYDIKKKVYKSYPLHNWASHFADCMRYLCISLPKTRDGTTPEELSKRYNEAMYGEQSNHPSFFRDDLPNY